MTGGGLGALSLVRAVTASAVAHPARNQETTLTQMPRRQRRLSDPSTRLPRAPTRSALARGGRIGRLRDASSPCVSRSAPRDARLAPTPHAPHLSPRSAGRRGTHEGETARLDSQGCARAGVKLSSSHCTDTARVALAPSRLLSPLTSTVARVCSASDLHSQHRPASVGGRGAIFKACTRARRRARPVAVARRVVPLLRDNGPLRWTDPSTSARGCV
jgi:hypothetical protein